METVDLEQVFGLVEASTKNILKPCIGATFMVAYFFIYIIIVNSKQSRYMKNSIFIRPSRDSPYYVIEYGGRAGGHPHRFLHNNFRSVYRIFTKLGHMIPLWKGKNCIYFGVIRSKLL
jgi:hypothetical protein